MIGSARTGRGFGGLQVYLLEGRGTPLGHERVAWTSSRNLLAPDPELAAYQMRTVANRSEKVEQPVYHLSLSAAPGEDLAPETWERIADRVLVDLGLSEHQALLVAHRDTEHPHVHLMVNRVHPETGLAWSAFRDYARIEESLRRLERELGLREVPGHHYRFPGQERPERGAGSGERREALRTGEPSWQEARRQELRGVFREAGSWAELEAALRERGVRLQKRGRGLVVTDGERAVKASSIDRGASIHQLEGRFGVPFREHREQVERLAGAVERLERTERVRGKLRTEEARFGQTARRAREVLDRRERLLGSARSLRGNLEAQLGAIFEPRSVREAKWRFEEMGRRYGYERAAEALVRNPERFGRLRGLGVGPLGTVERRGALEATRLAWATARQLGGVVRRLADLDPAARDAARVYDAASRARRAVARTLRVLTSTRQLQHQVGRLGLALGARAVGLVLPAPAAKVVSLAITAYRAALELGRGLGEGRER